MNPPRDRHRFDICRIPRHMLTEDPHHVLRAARELVARQGQVGDLILLACPPGQGDQFLRELHAHLEAEHGTPP